MAVKTPETDCTECRFKFGNTFSTLAHYEPLYDKSGKIISTDSNKVSGQCDCVQCGRHWTYISAHGKTTFHEWNQPK